MWISSFGVRQTALRASVYPRRGSSDPAPRCGKTTLGTMIAPEEPDKIPGRDAQDVGEESQSIDK
jgi:hypothetical protein